MVDFKVVVNGNYLCGESPIWDTRDNKFYWCDLLPKQVYRINQQTRKSEVMIDGYSVGGFAMNKSGGYVLSTLEGIFLWDEKRGCRLIADKLGDDLLKGNDCIADPEGRLLFGSVFYDAFAPSYELGKLFKVEKDGKVEVLDDGIHLSNGLGFSPDEKILYFSDTIAHKIFAYDYDKVRGKVSNKRIFVDVPLDEGMPDGMTVDAQGYVWSAQWYGKCVMRYDPDGKVERKLETPARQTTSLIFGGDNFEDIYITTAAKPAWLHMIPKDYDYDDVTNLGGSVYLCNLGIKGKPEYVADINID